MPVKTETFRELSGPLVHTNFGGNSYGPIIGPYLYLGKFEWTEGPEVLLPVKSKRGREEGDGTENVINCRDICRKLS